MLECRVAAHSIAKFKYEDVNALRKHSDTLPGTLGNSILRHSDEQTLSVLVAVRDAVAQIEQPTDFSGWGVVVSTRYLGRSAFADALLKFASDGPWNVSVQVVPNRSLHSPASMVGLALGCHGPCVGVGGGLDGEADAWLTAATLLDQQALPGIWLIFAGWDPDTQIDDEGIPRAATQCTGLAIALQSTGGTTEFNEADHARLRIIFDPSSPSEIEVPARNTALSLFEAFSVDPHRERGMNAVLGGGLRAELNWQHATVSTIPLPSMIPAAKKKAA